MFTDVGVHSVCHILASDFSQYPCGYCILHEPSPLLLYDLPPHESAYLNLVFRLCLDPLQMRRLAREAVLSRMNLHCEKGFSTEYVLIDQLLLVGVIQANQFTKKKKRQKSGSAERVTCICTTSWPKLMSRDIKWCLIWGESNRISVGKIGGE